MHARLTERRGGTALLLTALLLVAANLRLGVTSASSLLAALTASGALTPVSAIIVPALPTAVFAIAGFGTARLSARLGVERTILVGMAALTTGLAIRAVPEPWVVVLGTVIATGGLAIVNILLPAAVRAHFGTRIGPVTTAYTTLMSLGSAAAAATAVPLASAIGSPSLGLAAWALPALLGLTVWAVVAPRAERPVAPVAPGEQGAAVAVAGAGFGRGRRAPLPAGTGLLAAYFSLQALLSYVVMGWLPSIAHDAGIPPERSGLLLGIAMAVGVPATVVVVSLARSARRMRIGFVLVGAAGVAALTGLLLAPAALPEIWAALLGFGMCAFSLVLALIAGFGESAAETARVSSVVQSVGYSIATLGPLGAGAVHQLTGSWSMVLVALACCTVLQGGIGLALTRVVARRG